ncbi:MAG: hypothetical protein MJZ20_05730 [Bacteroidaceae bacterium]|nr:hypothetical protein [Bacteroidaceae bacterium]
MNPLAQNPILNLINTLQNNDPQEMAQNILNTNPDARAFMQEMQNTCGQRDPKEFTLELCKQRGVNTDFVMRLANMMGLK